MIRISPDVRIKASIKAGSVYYFAEEALKSREPHYFIVINRDPLTDTVLLLVCASSQIQKVNKRRRGCPPETLVQVSTSQYSGFTRTSVVDAIQASCKGSTFREITLGRLRTVEVPLPPLPEQRRIVAELDALQAQVDGLKRLQAETAAELDALLPSILDKAFKGEL